MKKTQNLIVALILLVFCCYAGSWMMVQKCLADGCGWCVGWHQQASSLIGIVLAFIPSAILLYILSICEVRKTFIVVILLSIAVLFGMLGSHYKYKEQKRSSLQSAVEKWDLEEAKKWLNRGANPNSRIDLTEETILFRAVELQNLSMVSLLLDKGADPNIGRCSIYCPMFMAYKRSSKDIILKLRAHGGKAPCWEHQKLLISNKDVKPSEFDTDNMKRD